MSIEGIHIYGYGTVGQAVHSLFKDENVEISDPQKGYEITEPGDGNLIVFICIDDLEAIKQIIKKYCYYIFSQILFKKKYN